MGDTEGVVEEEGEDTEESNRTIAPMTQGGMVDTTAETMTVMDTHPTTESQGIHIRTTDTKTIKGIVTGKDHTPY